MVRNKSSNTNHGKTSILQFLQLELLSLGCIGRPKFKVVHCWFIPSKEGLTLQFTLVLPSLKDTTDYHPLGPPLWIGLEDSIDGVGGGNICRVECSKELREEPSNGGEHGRTAIGKFSSAGPVCWDVVTEA